MASSRTERFTTRDDAMFFKTDIVSSIILAIVAYAAVRIVQLVRKKKPYPLPPGPKPWPILGNITDLPKTGVREWEFWLKHKETYGQSHPFSLSFPD